VGRDASYSLCSFVSSYVPSALCSQLPVSLGSAVAEYVRWARQVCKYVSLGQGHVRSGQLLGPPQWMSGYQGREGEEVTILYRLSYHTRVHVDLLPVLSYLSIIRPYCTRTSTLPSFLPSLFPLPHDIYKKKRKGRKFGARLKTLQ